MHAATENPDPLAVAAALADAYGADPSVRAIALGGSAATGMADARSDIDLYVYVDDPDALLALRREIAAARAEPGAAEIDNRFFEPDDEWADRAGIAVDVMFRSPDAFAESLADVLVRHRPALGYTTCLAFNVATAIPLRDRDGWYADLQRLAQAPYPEGLRRAIVRHNTPMLRGARASYHAQLALAAARDDAVSANHRTAAFLASAFDVLFALARRLHPGEKRLLAHAESIATPPGFARAVAALVAAPPRGKPAIAAEIAEGIEAQAAARLDERGGDPSAAGA
ncbi:nucleotidyltransferase domain-containing protein [Salinarimonas sp.]|uniref:nucleotidyltransferase domain-containing protein n=1 Tax=Salinarimonas sp. TaxID=2766526 RepID=UPI0032D90A90